MSVEQVEGETLRDIAQDVEQLTFRVGRGRDAGPGYMPRHHGDYLPRSPVVGEASPLSPRLDWQVVDGDGEFPIVEARGSFGAAYEGPPGFVHGGWIACAFGEVLRIADIEAGHPRRAPPPAAPFPAPAPPV